MLCICVSKRCVELEVELGKGGQEKHYRKIQIFEGLCTVEGVGTGGYI
jgi:hypothetical protein